MTETLGQHQRRFVPMVAKLIYYVYAQGDELTFGECYRSPEQAALNAQHGTGIANSLHILRLAIDLQLFRNGIYMTDSADYESLGKYWESLDAACAWGGRFSKPDGNHFSLAWAGIR